MYVCSNVCVTDELMFELQQIKATGSVLLELKEVALYICALSLPLHRNSLNSLIKQQFIRFIFDNPYLLLCCEHSYCQQVT